MASKFTFPGYCRFGRSGNRDPNTPPSAGARPGIFVSYAWGDNSSDDARQRTEVVDRLCEALRQDGWNILRDKTDMRPGELISGFMKRIGLADHVIVVLSATNTCARPIA
jgi:hypothetical protein